MTDFGVSETEKQLLFLFYNNLYKIMLGENKLKGDSIILSFFQLTSNVRHDLLEMASISAERIPISILKEFKRKNLVRDSDEINKLIVSAKGIWIIENDQKKLSIENIIVFLDEKFFDVSLKDKGITDKEKAILFVMIATRTFSIESPIDLKKDDYVLDAWERIIDECSKFLGELNVIKKMNKTQLYGKKGTEHIVSNLIRHTDSLPKKIKRLYNAPGNQQYFLDLYDNNEFLTDALEFLLKTIFDSMEFNYDTIEKIINFCQRIAYDEAANVHDFKKHIFALPRFDDKIRYAIEKALLQ